MATKRSMSQAKYDKDHCTYFTFKLNNETDRDVIDKLNSVPSRQGYVKQLVRNDIQSETNQKKQGGEHHGKDELYRYHRS